MIIRLKDDETMRLRDYEGSGGFSGASLRALGASLEALRKEVCWEHFSPPEMAPARETYSLKLPSEKTCTIKEREVSYSGSVCFRVG